MIFPYNEVRKPLPEEAAFLMKNVLQKKIFIRNITKKFSKRKKMKKRLFILGLILIMNGTAFASYEKALELFKEKKYEDSLKTVAGILEIAKDMEPESPNFKLRYLAAHNHWKLNNTKSAISHFKRCMEIKKDSIDPYVDLALYQTEIKRYNDAISTVNNGMKIKKDPMLYYVLGRVYLSMGSFWKAKTFFETANSLNPELYISYNALGITLMKLKKFSEANTAFSVANAVKPENAEIMSNLASSFYKTGKKEKAEQLIEKAIELDRDNQTIKNNLTMIKGK